MNIPPQMSSLFRLSLQPHFPHRTSYPESALQQIEAVEVQPQDHTNPYTATFQLAAIGGDETQIVEELVLQWAVPDTVHFGKEEFRRLCYAQTEFFNAQLLARAAEFLAKGGLHRVVSFRIAEKHPTISDRINYWSHHVPMSYFEVLALGGKPSNQFGAKATYRTPQE